MKLRVTASIILVLILTLTFHSVVPVNVLTAGFVYLVSILLLAAWVGLAESAS